MPFEVVPATPEDAYGMATIFWDAFITDPIVGPMAKGVPMEQLYAYSERRYRRAFTNAALEGMKFFKAVECGTEKMVAFSKWQHPHTLTKEQQIEKKAMGDDNPFGDDAPEGYNLKLSDEFFERIEEKHSKWVDDSKDYVLHVLAVSPNHQRKGLGALLIRDGLALADKDNARTYIEASPVGLQLYLRHGWKLVDDILMDMTLYGGSGVASEKILMRAPNGLSHECSASA